MSDRIGVMSAGRVQQIGTPAAIYERPENRFVADFVGDTNLLDAVVESRDGELLRCRLADGETLRAGAHEGVRPGQRGTVSLRPEQLAVSLSRTDGDCLEGRLGEATYLGTDTRFEIELGAGARLSARVPNGERAARGLAAGDPVFVRIADGAARFLAG